MDEIAKWLPGALPNIFDDQDVQLELGSRLAVIDPRLKWEVGPYWDRDTYFAFSPNFFSDLLPVTEALAKTMPAIEGWRFLDAKPRKRWSTRKVLVSGVEYGLDNWRYRLVQFKNGEFFDIDFFTFDRSIDENVWEGLGGFLAASELGEKLFMKAIDRVNVSAMPQHGESSIHIESLHPQIVDLFRGELPSE